MRKQRGLFLILSPYDVNSAVKNPRHQRRASKARSDRIGLRAAVEQPQPARMVSVMTTHSGKIRVGIGGWTFAPWRGPFYPKGLSQKRELEFASRHVTSIEINGTYYGSQSPESFARWWEETPDDFVFAVKGPRFATNRRLLAEAGESIDRFLAGGVLELGDKLGPINWQFAATKKYDPDDFAAFINRGDKVYH